MSPIIDCHALKWNAAFHLSGFVFTSLPLQSFKFN
jgi:hypothetical protein